jgi:hypothetical protein
MAIDTVFLLGTGIGRFLGTRYGSAHFRASSQPRIVWYLLDNFADEAKNHAGF